MLARGQDSKFLFGNGRSTLTAVDRIAAKFGCDEKSTIESLTSSMTTELAIALVDGFDFEVLYFQNDLDAVAYWCAVHDEDNNQVLYSTVETKVDLCKRIAKVCGKVDDVVGYLVNVWGQKKDDKSRGGPMHLCSCMMTLWPCSRQGLQVMGSVMV